MDKIPHICTIGQLSEETDISAYTIRKWIKQGAFKTLRSGTKYLINYDVFMRFLNGETTPQITTPSGIRKVMG